MSVPRACLTRKSVINLLAMCGKCVSSVIFIVVVIIGFKAGLTTVKWLLAEIIASEPLSVSPVPDHHFWSECGSIVVNSVAKC